MHLNIQSRHLKITPALNEAIKNKINKIKYYFDYIVHAHVVLEVIKTQQIAEVTITVEHHHFHNRISSDDMYKSIGLLFDKIENQVHNYKEHKNTPVHYRKDILLKEVSETTSSEGIEILDDPVDSKPMTDAEALLQLQAMSLNYLGFIGTPKDGYDRVSFAIREKDHIFKIIHYNTYLEEKICELNDADIEIKEIKILKYSTELIESAVDYLEHNEEAYRLFRSARSDRLMLLYKTKPNLYSVIRDPV